MLLRHGAHVDQTPPHCHCPIVELLQSRGTNPNPADANRHTALSVPLSEVVELLLEHGAHVEQHD